MSTKTTTTIIAVTAAVTLFAGAFATAAFADGGRRARLVSAVRGRISARKTHVQRLTPERLQLVQKALTVRSELKKLDQRSDAIKRELATKPQKLGQKLWRPIRDARLRSEQTKVDAKRTQLRSQLSELLAGSSAKGREIRALNKQNAIAERVLTNVQKSADWRKALDAKRTEQAGKISSAKLAGLAPSTKEIDKVIGWTNGFAGSYSSLKSSMAARPWSDWGWMADVDLHQNKTKATNNIRWLKHNIGVLINHAVAEHSRLSKSSSIVDRMAATAYGKQARAEIVSRIEKLNGFEGTFRYTKTSFDSKLAALPQ